MVLVLGAPKSFMQMRTSTFPLKTKQPTHWGRRSSISSNIESSRNHGLKFNLAKAPSNGEVIRLEEFDRGEGQVDMIMDIFNGKLLKDRLVFEQNFMVRSYELDSDFKLSIGVLFNILQETSLNQLKSMGLMAEGFGSTTEMSKRNLIWVISKIHIVVDSYPKWNDIIQVQSWMSTSGRNGMRFDFVGRDYKTGKTLFRAFSVCVMMDKNTRKLSKFIKEAREETKAFFMDSKLVIDDDGRKLRDLDIETADYVRPDLKPQLYEMDVNKHVSNTKYIYWVLESVPESMLETHELSSINMQFRKECGKESVLQSLSSYSTQIIGKGVEMEHTLRLQHSGCEILRGRTLWMPKN